MILKKVSLNLPTIGENSKPRPSGTTFFVRISYFCVWNVRSQTCFFLVWCSVIWCYNYEPMGYNTWSTMPLQSSSAHFSETVASSVNDTSLNCKSKVSGNFALWSFSLQHFFSVTTSWSVKCCLLIFRYHSTKKTKEVWCLFWLRSFTDSSFCRSQLHLTARIMTPQSLWHCRKKMVYSLLQLFFFFGFCWVSKFLFCFL